ncbi:hypothetical protein Celal_0823 [Cellulophaga algicola DSM 14237]|uniref:Uncharacterized protein n=1 Tax=Cellulophaga algicola (strain DSM 14237 / IC166 / ACAM 630) TaxID=688270 RepID=E6XEV1_CELAD|nr:hypothetical protein [Cellulophaga algicola]ADV48153.1 hypothetical protein Celal_0823 [Cellulophaga algicola DSM 14237]
MKLIASVLVLIFLGLNISYCQNLDSQIKQEFNQREWDAIVDYVNEETTLLYINEYPNKTKEESISAKLLDSILKDNSVLEPIDNKKILYIIEIGWGKTTNNIFKPISVLKMNSPKNLDSLFSKVSSLLEKRKSKVHESLEFIGLKNKILEAYNPDFENEIIVKYNTSESNIIPPVEVKSGINYYGYLIIPSVLFFLLSIFLFLKYRSLIKGIEELKGLLNNEKIITNKKDFEIEDLRNAIKDLNIKSNASNIIDKNKMDRLISSSHKLDKTHGEDKVSREIILTTVNNPREAKILYAGKPSLESKFLNISNEPVANQTIFKLTVDQENEKIACFEVALISAFMTRNITNSPDDYLFRVCNQENSNKDFSREIVTTKKGRAEFHDGQWTVREENKATIKFQ